MIGTEDMCKTAQRKGLWFTSRIFVILGACLFLFFTYFLSYFLLMDPNTPAYNESGQQTFTFSFRLAPSLLDHSGDNTYLVAKESIANWLFLPAYNLSRALKSSDEK